MKLSIERHTHLLSKEIFSIWNLLQNVKISENQKSFVKIKWAMGTLSSLIMSKWPLLVRRVNITDRSSANPII